MRKSSVTTPRVSTKRSTNFGPAPRAVLAGRRREALTVFDFAFFALALEVIFFIAAELLGRVCHAMELEPRYVQIAIERWQTFTGRRAVAL